jgi:hypothetical protein
MLEALFPDGITLDDPVEWGRMYLLLQIINKIDRYATNLKRGGHVDSMRDTAVYAAMLIEYDERHA